MPPQRNQRRIVLIDPEFQYWYMARMALTSAASVVLALTVLAVVYHMYGDLVVEVSQPNPFGGTEPLVATPTGSSFFSLLWPVLLACVTGTVGVQLVLGLYFSHRIAGPIYRAKVILTSMAAGDLSTTHLRFRNKDAFKPLADCLAEATLGMRDRFSEIQEICGEFPVEAPEGIRPERLDRLREILGRIKTRPRA